MYRRPSGALCDVDVDGQAEDKGEDEGEDKEEGEGWGREEKGGLRQEWQLFNSCPWSFPGLLSRGRVSST